MNKSPIFLLTLAVLGLGAVHAQNSPKPLSQEALTKTIDSFGIGDPLTKQPLSLSGLSNPKDSDATSQAEDFPDEQAEKKAKGPTEITAREATFDNKSHKAVFLIDVVVKDPEFNVVCDKLTAYLKHDDKAPADPKAVVPGKPPVKPSGATPRPAATPAPVKEKESGKGGLEKALAEMNGNGRVLITQDKVDADGKVNRNIGRGKKAHYDAVTGDVTLTGMPSVQQGFNTCIALEEGTIMILNREGRMRVTGSHKTVIKDASSSESSNGAGHKTGAKESSVSNLNNR